MKKSIVLEIYAISVCFTTLIIFIFVLGYISWDFVKIAYPQFGIYQSACYQTDKAYKNCFSEDYEYTRKEDPVAFPTGKALTEKRKNEYENKILVQRNNIIGDIFKETIMLIISVIIFLIHWRIASKIRKKHSE